ncbi:hypothetical protein CAL29_24300 [Bordetella genomosp. 10]|uniref:FAD-binding domain-containing protein n=1 Tax=Bordetella genomosp. 10 TaxID=1416804 RepID=A0A261S524_9BORD|nr:hypothetical protein CAL29_24300 [Bordetella genomosp. 10]
MKTVLVSGASIAGPSVAFWLARYGFDVTLIEIAPAVRSGGYPIDLRGPAVDVVERMELLEALKAAHVDTRRIIIFDPTGEKVRVVETGGRNDEQARDLEVRRTDLTSLLFDKTRNDVEYLFGESIVSLSSHEGGVDVAFRSGKQRKFDIVIGTDGLHSNTRGLAFGTEHSFERYIGRCYAVFSIPNYIDLSHEGLISMNEEKMAALYPAGQSDVLHALLAFKYDEHKVQELLTAKDRREIVAERFAGWGWEVPRMIEMMRESDDLFLDTMSQVRMPCWSTGRVVVAGDAAHAPTFRSGQGSSLAMIGAYILAGEIASNEDRATAFANYENIMRPFAEANQALAYKYDPSPEEKMSAYKAITLPDYSRLKVN